MPGEKDLYEGLREAFAWYKDNSDKVNKKPFIEFIDQELLNMKYIFIHGLGQTASSWDKLIAHLPADIKIYRPCLSAIAEGRQITYENLYNAFQNDCNRMEMPVCLCGISLGAVLALHYALDNPQKVKSLILIAPQYKMPRLLLSI